VGSIFVDTSAHLNKSLFGWFLPLDDNLVSHNLAYCCYGNQLELSIPIELSMSLSSSLGNHTSRFNQMYPTFFPTFFSFPI
jgi:hypothetical protein